MKLGQVALDGSKFKANASKHKAMSYGRMDETEKRLRAEIRKLLSQAEAADREEDKQYGRDRRGEAYRRVAATGSADRSDPSSQRSSGGARARTSQGRGEGSRGSEAHSKNAIQLYGSGIALLKGADGFVQSYNTQIAADRLSVDRRAAGHASRE